MTPAGKRDKRVTIQRSTSTSDCHNEQIEAWSDVDTRWTAVFYGRGDERRQAAAETGNQTATFVMLADSITRAVTIKDRLSYAGDWDIVGISPSSAEIEFTAVRAS
ncbi:head-tail adaptor protein [uncultured Novosphingobium sp.]|uniref:phage head completion protein n=1 Tax=uncultured Novosphingobium sp. TaxID=292277 RepID=UPI00374A8C68